MDLIFGNRRAAQQREEERNRPTDIIYGHQDYGYEGQDLPQGYLYPDDENYTRKGKLIVPAQPLGPELPPISQENYDPEAELASFLYTGVAGQIESGQIHRTDLLKIKYTFVAGSEWELIYGDGKGESQYARKTTGIGETTWNLSFDVGYRSLSPAGWPQLVIELLGPSYSGGETLKGYGCIHIPTSPGRYERFARIFCPVRETWWTWLKGKLFGPDCDLAEEPSEIASGEGREVTSVYYIGNIKIIFEVIQRNMARFGYKTY
ncbi:unnamed protein product [Blepharisma stoltei]|uniref:B9 domain-containing protein 1 n=1 Tax=Blepharisma stoltei TaxID=1481888 RepID=A0AAU9I687_9CILI|nr:unnamed protein product [Blepharisma stoltei]